MKRIEKTFFRYWWVILFALICFFGFEQGLKSIQNDYRNLFSKYQELLAEYELGLAEQEDLRLRIQSQHDPQWIELTLMRELGLVPEGKTKVFFKQS